MARHPALCAAILLAAACTPLPQTAERTAACPPCPACPACPGATVREPERAHYLAADFGALPGWARAALAPSLHAFVTGCARAERLGALAGACAAARSLPEGDEVAARRFFETAFQPYAVVSQDGADTGLVTGYYEPLLEGRRTPQGAFRQPVFGVPEDLVVVDMAGMYPELRDLRLRGRLEGRRLVPYYSRAEIEAAGARFAAPVIAWTADPVELFFLQIQGSGQIRLEDGSRIRVGYADQNGHPYRSLGRYLLERGELRPGEASMQGIKAWARARPDKLRDALNENPSFVFFRELPASGGPIGALGVPLSAGYSIAVDRRHVPLGAPVYLATTYPLSEEPLERLVAAQDTGGAIRGVARADFFWGSGAQAGEAAGHMRQRGRMWLLWPRGAALPPPP
jgi:membrane-bound lytic murein transglycosylase A